MHEMSNPGIRASAVAAHATQETADGVASNAEAEYHIGEAAQILGVCPRTLRHWEDKGLLVPAWRTASDYRLYTQDDLQTGFAIVLYKSAGLSIAEIEHLLSESSAATRLERLRAQREVLSRQLRNVHVMIGHLDEIIAYHQAHTEKEITMEEIKAVFGEDMPAYQEEAQQLYGHTPEWQQASSVKATLGRADYERIKDDHLEFVAALASAREMGVQPTSAEAAELVAWHRAQIGRWYEVSAAKQVLLARMYVTDQRFASNYQGNADYLLRLVEAQAQAEGVDLAHVEWGE